jgi:hypothetical protein
MAKVKIFGAPGCRVSFQLCDFLKRSSVDFDWVELKSDDDARQLPGVTDLGDQRLPVCEFDDGVPLYRPSVRDVSLVQGARTGGVSPGCDQKGRVNALDYGNLSFP